ncbi:MAG TPA: hypothetical protein VF200_07310 [Woeseiaceae bacterium]
MVSGPMRASTHYRTIFPAVLAALLAACAAPEPLRVELELEGGEWRLIGASWRRR